MQTDGELNINKFSRLYISVSSGMKLDNFLMKSLFLQYQIHPKLQSVASHSVWCHKTNIQFDSGLVVDLSKLENIQASEFEIKIELHTRNLLSSQLVGTATLTQKRSEIVIKAKKPILYFYKMSNVPLIEASNKSNAVIGRLIVTLAYGFKEHASYIEPPMNITPKPLYPIRCKNTHTNKKEWNEIAESSGWKTRSYIEKNWEKLALMNGWSPASDVKLTKVNNKIIDVEPDSDQIEQLIKPHKEAPPTSQDVFAALSPPPSPCKLVMNKVVDFRPLSYKVKPQTTATVSEINEILDCDKETEKRIDNFIRRQAQFGFRSPKPARTGLSRVKRAQSTNRWSTPPSGHYAPIQRSPSLDLLLANDDSSKSSDSPSSSEDDEDFSFTPHRIIRKSK